MDLLSLLDKIEEEASTKKVFVKSRLSQEIGKMYTFNALGICLGKLEKIDEEKYRNGLQRTRILFKKAEDFDF